ncbi:MAG: TonB-dependent receptor [Cytophagales bacterium]|nr:TonB-dependent receptor [Cytophagales bacterium]
MTRKILTIAFLLNFWVLSIAAQEPPDTRTEIEIEATSLKEVLQEIEVKTKFQFAYDANKIDGNWKINIEGKHAIKDILELIGQRLGLEYELVSSTIILTQKPRPSKEEEEATIFGHIREGESGENLYGATIYDSISKTGAISNYYGYFSLTLQKGPAQIHVSYLGSEPQLFSLDLQSDTLLEIRQQFSSHELKSVVVTGEEEALDRGLGTMVLTRKQLTERPAIGGEVDPIKVLQLLPGVQAGNEGSAGLYIRGGGPDQNLILLDGIPVYNSSHFFGFASVFNAEAIQSIRLIKGGFPARYAGRLSSVVDMSMREGHESEFHGSAKVGPLVGNVMVECPIVREKASFMLAARRSTLDLFLRPFREDRFSFYDTNLKLNFRPSKRDRLYFSSYLGRDRGSLRTEELMVVQPEPLRQILDRTSASVKWGSDISVLRWNHIWNPKLFSNISLSHSQYDFFGRNSFFREFQDFESDVLIDQIFTSSSDILDRGAKLEFDYFPNPNHEIRAGISILNHRFKPNITGTQSLSDNPVIFNNNTVEAIEYAGYVEDQFSIGEQLSFNVGLHAVNYEIEQKRYTSLQPRLAASFTLSPGFEWTASYSHVTQFLHLLTNPGLGLPTDLWVPATDLVPPQQAHQLTLGMQRAFPAWHLTTSLEGYYKSMSGLIEYKDGATFLSVNEDWQQKIEQGRGESYGLEWFTQYLRDRVSVSLGYTLAWSHRQFDNINFGDRFPYKYDRRHDVKLLLNYEVSKKIHFSMNWLYGTGIATTLPTGFFRGPADLENQENSAYRPLLDFDTRNGYRLRPSHRLDFSLTYKLKKTIWDHELTLAVYNAYNRRNPLFVDARPQVNFRDVNVQIQFQEYSLLPIIPSISYRIQV